MRLAPLFLVLLVCLWMLLASAAWAVVGIWARRGPRLTAFVAALAVGLAAVFALAGLRPGSGSLLLSLLIVPLLGVAVTVAIER